MQDPPDTGEKLKQDEYFLRLLMGSQSQIYAFILSMVHNGNDADDIMQETLTRMWRKFSQYTPGSSFNAWGVAIARNLVLKFIEKNRQSKLSFSPDIGKRIDIITSEKLASTENRVDMLRSCLSKISAPSRELLRLRYLNNVPTKMIAMDRGIAPHTMYRIMGRIHQSLSGCVRKMLLAMEGAHG